MDPFQFKTKLDQTIVLGVKARTVKELMEELAGVPESSVYFHTHKFLHQHHYLSPEPPNDLAYWVSEVLNEAELAEQLSSIDVIQFTSLGDLRDRFLEIMRGWLVSSERTAHAPPGEEFHFMSCRTYVLNTPYRAATLEEFDDCLGNVSVNTLYFHMFDARLRLAKGKNDFSAWFADLGKVGLAEAVAALDPYTQTLEGLRHNIRHLVRTHAAH